MSDSLSLEDSVATALSLITANDAMDAAAVAASFEPDGILRFANGRESQGIERIQKTLSAFFDSLGGLSHEVIGVTTGSWSGGHVVSVEAEVTYVRLDGSTVGPLPVTSTLRLTPQGTVARYQIYIDATPLSTPAESKKVTVEESR